MDDIKSRQNYLIITFKEYFKKLVPVLQDRFGLGLEVPESVSCSNISYMFKDSNSGIPGGHFNVYEYNGGFRYSIKLCEERNKTKFDLASLAAHDAGHLAVFKNAGNYELFNNPKDEFAEFFHVLEEGIAEKYRKAGMKFLKPEFGSLRYLWSLRSEYRVAENIVDFLNDRSVSIKDIVLHPDDFKYFLKDNFLDMIGLAGHLKIGFSKLFKC